MSPADTIERPYSEADVERLRGSVTIEHTLARLGAVRLRQLLADDEWVPALGAMTGGQAVQMVKAGLKAIYLSGWQVAADANLSGNTYPDQSLYPANSAPASGKASFQRRMPNRSYNFPPPSNRRSRVNHVSWSRRRRGRRWAK
jgi:isocitrate lyase